MDLYEQLDIAMAENAKLRAEIERLKGPFTCQHPPEYAGGACAACHAEWIDKATKLELQVNEIRGMEIGGHKVGDIYDHMKKRKPVVVTVGDDGKACCADCGKKDYPLENHKCESK